MKKCFYFLPLLLLLAGCSNSGSNGNANKKQPADRIEITNDMENAKAKIPSWIGDERVFEMKSPPAHSGTYACITNDSAQYSYHFEELLGNINTILPKRVIFSGWAYTTTANPNFAAICSITNLDQSYNWKAFPLEKSFKEVGKWIEFTSDFYIDDKPLNPDLRISIYTWNQSKHPIYIDDVKVVFMY